MNEEDDLLYLKLIEELYNLTPVVDYIRFEVDLLHAFFINKGI